jgi:hypothetical protein
MAELSRDLRGEGAAERRFTTEGTEGHREKKEKNRF